MPADGRTVGDPDQIGTRVSDWEIRRGRLDTTVGLLGERDAQLADLGDQSSRLLGASTPGRQATETCWCMTGPHQHRLRGTFVAVARVMVFATSACR